MTRIYGVGLIGVTPPTSWAVQAHLPALRALADQFRIAGIANSSADSARRAAAACGIDHGFESADALCASPDVDVVVITVRADRHGALVEKALAAGKHVFCEWPLGRTFEETRRLAALAAERDVIAMCGSQAVAHPTIRYAASLIRVGWLGEPLFVTVVADVGAWGAEMSRHFAYATEETTGASLLTIPLGHTLIGLREMFGPVATIFAETSTRRAQTRVIETGEIRPLNTPDNAIVGVTFQSGLAMSMHYRGGTNRAGGFRCEIIGTEGELHLKGSGGVIEMVELELAGARSKEAAMADMPIPSSWSPNPRQGVVAGNVMGLYERLYADLETGSCTAPSFANAVDNHRLVEAVRRSSREGRRISVRDIK